MAYQRLGRLLLTPGLPLAFDVAATWSKRVSTHDSAAVELLKEGLLKDEPTPRALAVLAVFVASELSLFSTIKDSWPLFFVSSKVYYLLFSMHWLCELM